MRIISFIVLSLILLPVMSCAAENRAQPAASAALRAAPEPTPENVTPPAEDEDYFCPMHKDVHGKKGDVCPKCGGMHLLPVHPQETDKMTPVPEAPAEE